MKSASRWTSCWQWLRKRRPAGPLTTILVLIQAAGTSGYQSFYSLVVGLSTMAAVIPYAFCAMAAGLIAAHAPGEIVPHVTVVEIIAFVFAVFTLYGCGAECKVFGLLTA